MGGCQNGLPLLRRAGGSKMIYFLLGLAAGILITLAAVWKDLKPGD
jgi:hypothetical protein